MLKMTRWFLWGLFTLILLTAIDQLLLRVDLSLPVYREVRTFYVDFRGRLVGLTSADLVAQTIKTNRQPESPANQITSPTDTGSQPRYLYVDGDGALQFADSLDDVPLQYRRDAQPLSE